MGLLFFQPDGPPGRHSALSDPGRAIAQRMALSGFKALFPPQNHSQLNLSHTTTLFMRFAVHIFPRLAMILALVLALASTGFAHTIERAEDSPDYAAFVAAGGALSDLCGDSQDPGHGTLAQCEACRLVAAALIPGHPATPGVAWVQRPTASAPLARRPDSSLWRDPAHGSRAPPAHLTTLL
ncbi:hypothetical protein PhaeoP14_03627 (plasmid) [Phaeobacter piscinae]|nr:hypothetical protein PhaeoP14_03627 [Phaeobacter piscinae]